ncbi:hypothetical protein BASA81_013824 [Batrachochytrium salamandrivorans]|nr:hypothetical protein BASA81_013824 [Batrachochytrium salamandrivorans]
MSHFPPLASQRLARHPQYFQQPAQPQPRIAVPQYNEYGTICNLFNPYDRDPKTMTAFHTTPIQHQYQQPQQQQQQQLAPLHFQTYRSQTVASSGGVRAAPTHHQAIRF